MEVYLIRHTQVAVDKGICYGQTDVPLASTFSEETSHLLEKLSRQVSLLEAKVLSSPSKRCSQLAEQISQETTFVPALMEMNFGDWEMCPWKDLPPAEANVWMEDFVHQRPPGGENFTELKDRTTFFFDALPQLNAAPVIIVTHAGVIRSLVCHAIGLPLSKAFQLEIDYGSITKLVFRWGLWHLKFLNF